MPQLKWIVMSFYYLFTCIDEVAFYILTYLETVSQQRENIWVGRLLISWAWIKLSAQNGVFIFCV